MVNRAMVTTPSKTITLQEFLALPETKPASEYIDGKIIQKPMSKGKHSTIQTELSAAINVALKPQKTARAFSELRCTFGGRSTVFDVTVFTDFRTGKPTTFEGSLRSRQSRRKTTT